MNRFPDELFEMAKTVCIYRYWQKIGNVTAYRAMLAAAPVSEAKAQGVVIPEGWIPLTIEHEPGYPEDVAFGPKRMMDRLKKWLDRYFEMRLAAAPKAEPQPSDDARDALVDGADINMKGYLFKKKSN